MEMLLYRHGADYILTIDSIRLWSLVLICFLAIHTSMLSTLLVNVGGDDTKGNKIPGLFQ